MSWTDYIFGFGPKAPDKPRDPVREAVNRGDSEAVVHMLEEIQDPCARLNFAKHAGQTTEDLHSDGTETLSVWRTYEYSATVVAKIDQPICKH